ncbi:MAG TPA: Phenylacetic acid catabolic protein [Candidatus Limnocylindria bacterium]
MADQQSQLPPEYHQAVLHWQRHNFPEYERLEGEWDRYFPKDDAFCLCARLAQNTATEIEIGDRKGQPKATAPRDLDPDAAHQLLGIIRAQASTEFGSIQQHHQTLARANDPQDQAWVLRVMAEELRHGYQMIHLLTSADWSPVTDQKPQDMVEEILSMQTGSHVLAAFNLEYDSFVDNVVFAALIDRVGKYQLTMQKVNAYKPMADSMPPMLREEAFHLATGVIPMRRWCEEAAKPDALITMATLQKAVNKWYGRGLEMFGDERGGETNVKLGLKDKTNRVAQDEYVREVEHMLDDLNQRHVRARFPTLSRDEADALYARVKTTGEAGGGLRPDELLRLPDRAFFRRRGEFAFQLVGVEGQKLDDAEAYIAHVRDHLPEAYLASLDVRHWADLQRGVTAGTMTLKDAMKSMPRLARVGGACPCANSVRWIMEIDAPAGGAGEARLHP